MQGSSGQSRLGFHYYPDTFHYREEDLKLLLPRLSGLRASWITLRSHPERAIPEFFIQTLLQNNITPIIHIPQPVKTSNDLQHLSVLFQAYAKWGVKYLVLFDRPNQKESWEPSAWSQGDLVERFLDLYIPAAEAVQEEGLIPVFPVLEPGGDFWDTVFLQTALKGIERRGNKKLIESLVLSAYAWTYGKDIYWGKGGPDHWPASRPYFTPQDSQDQLGFFIFDWYLSIAKSTLGFELPILLLAAGCRKEDCAVKKDSKIPSIQLEQVNLSLFRMIERSQHESHMLSVWLIACNFWLLSATEGQPEVEEAWFPDNRPPNSTVTTILTQNSDLPDIDIESVSNNSFKRTGYIGHYLLIPEKSYLTKDWLFDCARSLVESTCSHPKQGIPLSEDGCSRPFSRFFEFGASISSALSARRVTIIGSSRWLDESYFSKLASAGCVIEEIYGDGTLIASKLSIL